MDKPAFDLLECLTSIHSLEPSSYTLREGSSLTSMSALLTYESVQFLSSSSRFLLQFMGMHVKGAFMPVQWKFSPNDLFSTL